MTISYTGNLKLALPITGTEAGTWGDVVNQQITSLLDQSVAGTVSLTSMTNADYTLTNGNGSTANEARYMALLVPATLTLTAARNIIVPTSSKAYIIRNLSTGGFAVTLKTSGGTGISVPNGKTMALYCDGTNVIDGTDYLASLTLGTALPVLSGGTGVTTSTGTGSVVLNTSPTLVTPALGTPTALVGTNITGTAAGLTAGNVTTNANLTGAVTSTGNATLLGSFTSLQLSTALTDETGSGAAVFGTSPTFTTSVVGGATMAVFNTTSTTVNAFGAATALNIGAATGTLTVANTTLAAKALTATSIANSALTATRLVYSGTAGLEVDSANLTFNGTDLTVSGAVNAGSVNATTLDLTNLEVTNIKAKDGTASITLANSTGVASFTANPVLSGGTANGVAYLNGSKVLTTGSALTFDGTTLSSTAAMRSLKFLVDSTAWLDGAVANTLGFYTSSAEKMRLDGSGNLGIGTTAPSANRRLHVYAAAIKPVKVESAGASSQIEFQDSGTTNQPSVGSSGETLIFQTGFATRATIDASGNLGIGTTSPTYKLDVAASAARIKSVSAYAGLLLSSGDPNAATRNWVVASNFNSYGDFAIVQSNAKDGDPIAAGTTRLALNASGNLGIGTTSPTSITNYRGITVNGTDGSIVDSLFNGTLTGRIQAYATGYALLAQGAATPLIFGTNNTERMRINATGNVGIGTSSPSFPLDVQSTGTGSTIASRIYRSDGTIALLRIGNSSSGSASSAPAFGSDTTAAVFYTDNAEKMRLDSSGNLGIGTSSPSQKLEVASTSGAAGSALLRLTSNGSVGMEAGLEFFTTPTDTTAATRAGRIYAAYDGGNYASARLSFQSMTAGNVLVDTMHLKAGNVGIGTTTPVGRLSVIGGADNATQVVINGSTGTTARGLRIATGTTGFQANDTAILDAQHPTNAALVFQTGSTERMRLDSSGRLGIGTSSPTFKLQVIGTGQVSVSAAGTQQVLQLNNSDTTVGTQAVKLAFSSAGVTKSSINVAVYNNDYMAFNVGSDTERMRIDATGNLLVGLTSATGVAKLQVSGPIRTTGYTVATLPAGTVGMRTYVTDALAPSFGATVVGGGAVTIPVFYNGTNWIVA